MNRVLALLWRHWTLLGVPGHLDDKANSAVVIDPEALVLATSRLGRFDARLFDEALHWLRHLGKFISIQRLKTLHQLNHEPHPLELAAIASALQENTRLGKWSSIEKLADLRSGEEPFFRGPDGAGLPMIGESDPHFTKFGFFRSRSKPDKKSSKADLETALAQRIARHPALLLLKLRALFGVNARAEIIAALLSQPSTHPAELALRIGYLSRSVQDTLNEMTLSGLVASHRAAGSREKHFSLRPSDWSFLITWPEPRFPAWIDWAALYALLQDVVLSAYNPQIKADASPLLLASRLRQAFERHRFVLARSGLDAYFLKSSQSIGVEFTAAFTKELDAL